MWHYVYDYHAWVYKVRSIYSAVDLLCLKPIPCYQIFAAMSKHPQVEVMKGLMQVTDWRYTIAHTWVRKLLVHYQRPPFQKQCQTLVTSLPDFMIVCSHLPIPPAELRTKLNEIMHSHGYSAPDLNSLAFHPFEPETKPVSKRLPKTHTWPPRRDKCEEGGIYKRVEAQAIALGTALTKITEPPWMVRTCIHQGQPYLCARDVGRAIGLRCAASSISRILAPQDSIPLLEIQPPTKRSVRQMGLKYCGQCKYITLDVVKRLVQNSRMSEAGKLAELLRFSLEPHICTKDKSL